MKINTSSYLSALEAARTSNTQTTQTSSTTTTKSLLDSYTPSNSDDETLYANYNDILSTMSASLLSAISNTDTSSSTNTESDKTTTSISDAVKSIIDNLSDSLRANKDTILSTLQSLGLTPEDLLDSDNIDVVANSLAKQAEELGLPAVDDLDEIITNLKSSIEDTLSNLGSEYSLTEEDLKTLIEELKEKLSQHTQSDDDTYTTLLNAMQAAGVTEEA